MSKQTGAAIAAIAAHVNWDRKELDLQAIIEAGNQGKLGKHLTDWLAAKSWEVQEAVQQVQAAATPIVKRALTAWKTIKVGGIHKKELAKKVAKSCEEVGSYAQDLMTKEAFVTAPEQSDVDLVILTPADLGFTKNPRTDAFMTKEFCKEWSEKHLDGYAIELCEPEDGPHLRMQYQDQPKGEVLWMAMERITDSGGNPRVFYVRRGDSGDRWLGASWVNPDGEWILGSRLVFRLRKLPQPSTT